MAIPRSRYALAFSLSLSLSLSLYLSLSSFQGVLPFTARLDGANDGSAGDFAILLTTFGGVFMAALATVRYVTRGYIFHAEELKWEWLGDDSVLVTKFGDEVIGTVVLGWEKGEKGTRRKKSGKGIVRGWTVRLKYRHKGVGRVLLEEAVKLVNEKGGDGIEFAEDHASMLDEIYL